MKRIVLNKHDETIGIDKVMLHDYIGIKYNKEKYYILKVETGAYAVVKFLDVDISENTLHKTPNEIIQILNSRESYVFETREELLSWLKQD